MDEGEPMVLTVEQLAAGVAGEAVGVRLVSELMPLGGPGDKVFPPTYTVDDRADTRYAIEPRIVVDADGTHRRADSVVLDSVASQANRMELTLLAAIRSGQLAAPINAVDFAGQGLFGLDRISDYEAPHRVFDAILRDSFDGDVLFRHGAIGRAITDANGRNATALLVNSPHSLVFGAWDSTGPRGGRGAKYERAITSEIVAHDIAVGTKTASRIDPLAVELRAGTVYESTNDVRWTLDPSDAVTEKGKPRLYARGGERPGRPSVLNHGNVAPSLDSKAGGITAARITATTVLSFIQLRRLGFGVDGTGTALAAATRTVAENAARTALAALGLAAAVLAVEQGFDLRSRCVLVPAGRPRVEMVTRAGDAQPLDLDGAEALRLVDSAAASAAATGLGWRTDELSLRPSDQLVDLVRRSQDLSVAVGGDTDPAA